MLFGAGIVRKDKGRVLICTRREMILAALIRELNTLVWMLFESDLCV